MTIADYQPPPRLEDTAAMTNTLIAELIKTYRSGARCAAALGMSRQAFNAALKRGHLSTDAALHAANLLKLDPGAALLANATATKNPAAPILNPAPALPSQPPETALPDPLYYVKLKVRIKKMISSDPLPSPPEDSGFEYLHL